jgi:hypothetical protein
MRPPPVERGFQGVGTFVRGLVLGGIYMHHSAFLPSGFRWPAVARGAAISTRGVDLRPQTQNTRDGRSVAGMTCRLVIVGKGAAIARKAVKINQYIQLTT